MEKYEVLGLAGEGSFGRVYKVKCKKTGETVAFKIIRKRGRSEKELLSLRQEFQIQQHLHHPNIIQMLDSFETENEIVVVTEYAEKELYEILGKEGYLSEDRVREIACDLVSALYYLHSHRVLHRDLKPQNILIEASGVAKLCDFGFARSMSSGTHVLTSIKGTPLYMAPELIEEKPYDHNADLWSLGCIIYELLVGAPPFCTTSILHLVRLIRHEEVKWPDFLSENCLSFIRGLLQKDSSQRLTWPELLEHPFVKNKVLILKDEGVATPLTNPLTMSQAKAKEIQKKDLAFQTAGQSKLLEKALQKVEQYERKLKQSHQRNAKEEQERKLKLSHQKLESTSSVSAVKFSGGTKESLNLCTYLSPSKTMNAKCCDTATNQNIVSVSYDLKKRTSVAASKDKVLKSILKASASVKESANNTDGAVLKKSSDMREKRTVSLSVGVNCTSASVDGIAKLLQKSNLVCADVRNTYDSGIVNLNENQVGLSQTDADFKRENKSSAKETASKTSHNKETAGVSRSRNAFTLHSWDSAIETQPIENEEWLAFLQNNMEEIMEGDVDSLQSCGCVSVLMSPLRNPGASCRVVEYIACLLSLPFVVKEVTEDEIEKIKQVYLEVKIVPNLVYASKLLARQKGYESDDPSQLCPVSDLSADELQALECIYLLLCHLVYSAQDFLLQLCDAIAILNAVSLIQQFLLLDRRKVRVVTDLVAILCQVLRVMPENAQLVEQITLCKGAEGSCVIDFSRMLTHQSPILRARICVLLQLLGRYCCRALKLSWSKRLQDDLESLLYDSNGMVESAAKEAIEELKELQFYYKTSDSVS